MDDRITTDLVCCAFVKTVWAKCPAPGLIHHSDRSAQYCSRDYQALLQQFGMNASMSRRGNCYDNAPMERFWGTLNNELLHHRRYEALIRLGKRSPSTSRSSATANGAIRGSAISHWLFLCNSVINGNWQHEAAAYGVRY